MCTNFPRWHFGNWNYVFPPTTTYKIFYERKKRKNTTSNVDNRNKRCVVKIKHRNYAQTWSGRNKSLKVKTFWNCHKPHNSEREIYSDYRTTRTSSFVSRKSFLCIAITVTEIRWFVLETIFFSFSDRKKIPFDHRFLHLEFHRLHRWHVLIPLLRTDGLFFSWNFEFPEMC